MKEVNDGREAFGRKELLAGKPQDNIEVLEEHGLIPIDPNAEYKRTPLAKAASEDITVVKVFGKNGTGKGTMVDGLRGQGVHVVESGKIVRDAMEEDGEYTEELGPYIKGSINGGLIPDEIMVPIAAEKLALSLIDASNPTEIVVLDGVVRTDNQNKMFKEWVLAEIQLNADLNLVPIYLDAPDDLVIKRSTERREKDIAEKGISRPDDKPEIVQKRLETFRKHTLPVVKKYAADNKLYTIDAKQSILEVRKAARQIIFQQNHPDS